MVGAASVRKVVEFLNIELAQLADGTIHVGITATTVDEKEHRLLCQQITSERVESIEDALAVIRDCVIDTIVAM